MSKKKKSIVENIVSILAPAAIVTTIAGTIMLIRGGKPKATPPSK